jgi:glycosyltransferase involved in cell wall biosynthesis
MLKSILIDATHYGRAHPTGVEKYTDQLLPLLSQNLISLGVEVSWIGHTSEMPVSKLGQRNPRIRWVCSPHRKMWSQLVLPTALRILEPSLYFTPSGIPPIRYSGQTALTIHDMTAYNFPNAYSRSQKLKLTYLSRLAANRAGIIFTPSKYTASEVNRIWKIGFDHLTVTPLGYEMEVVEPEGLSGIEPDPIFLYIGRLETKKNLITILQAFRKLAGETACQLVLAGDPGKGYSQIQKALKSLPLHLQKRVILPGYISEENKEWLMRNATALLVPGIGEGFGLPVLEAFAHRLPAICAQAGSLIEIGGEAVLFAQADIPTDWMLQMKAILNNPHLAKQLTERGQQYLKKYTWTQTAHLTSESLIKHF